MSDPGNHHDDLSKLELTKHGKRISQIIAKTLNVGVYSLCPCGSGDKYKFCCYTRPIEDILTGEPALVQALKYRDSKGGAIQGIPVGIFNILQRLCARRLQCLYPKCNELPVSCHLIPENVLRSHFGSYCQEFRMQDSHIAGNFTKRGVGEAGTRNVFCSRHDCDVFSAIDTLPAFNFNSKQDFLLAFKAIAFSLRQIQSSLGVDYQVEITRPIIHSKSVGRASNAPKNYTVDLSYLHSQYVRFCHGYELFKRSIVAYEAEQWDFFAHQRREIQFGTILFFAGHLNPSHDLNGVKLNSRNAAISMTCNIIAHSNRLYALLSCAEGSSKSAYQGFFTQINQVNEDEFVTVLNSLMTVACEKPLISEGAIVTTEEIQKIGQTVEMAQSALKGEIVLGLTNKKKPIRFLK